MADYTDPAVVATEYRAFVQMVSDPGLRYLADCHMDAIAIWAGHRNAEGAMLALDIVRAEQADRHARGLGDGPADDGVFG